MVVGEQFPPVTLSQHVVLRIVYLVGNVRRDGACSSPLFFTYPTYSQRSLASDKSLQHMEPRGSS